MTGTQSIQRALAVLDAVAFGNRHGLRASELAVRTKLVRPTLHRILKLMLAEGLVSRDEPGKRYRLGPRIYELGVAATPPVNIRDACQPALSRLSKFSEDTVFLTVRSGLDSVVIDRREGAYPVKALTAEIGAHRPLPSTAGGLAILIALPSDERDRIVASNAKRYRNFGHLSAGGVQKMIQRSLPLGYALSLSDVLPEVSAVGVAICNKTDPSLVYGALSIAAMTSRLEGDRRGFLVQALMAEASEIERTLSMQIQSTS